MIEPDQIPEEVVAAIWATLQRGGGVTMREALAAGLNEWPEMECRPTFGPSRIILPLPQENANAEG